VTLTDNGNGTATLTGTPTNNQVGDHPVALQVSDGVELASQPFTITVVNINDAPVLVQPVDQTSAKGDAISLQLSASDVDAGDILSYSAPGLPGGLSVDPASGLISGTVSGTTGVFPVTAEVNDGHGGTSSKTFNWTVTEPIQTLTVNKVGNGTVTPDKLPPYYLNDVVTLTAAADAGWTFSGWTDCTGTGNTCTVTMDSNKAVTATFTQDEYTLTIDVVGNGTVTRVPDQATYHYGEVVTLTAAPEEGWILDYWSENIVDGNVTIHDNTTVTATFKATVQVPLLNVPSGAMSSWDKAFHWTGIAEADFYQLEVYDASDVLLYGQWYTSGICSGLDCAVSPAETQNLANGDYKWRVKTYGASGYGPWTAFQNFTLNIVDVPNVTLVSPAGLVDSWDKAFHWTGLSGADYYHLEVYDASDTLIFGQWFTTNICSGLDCGVSPAETKNLANGDYKWRVQTYGSTGYTPWTAYQNFTLNLATLNLLAPSGRMDSWDKAFRWTGVAGADYYHLEVYDASDVLLYGQWYTSGICSGLDCGVSPAETQNLANGDYKWRVQTYGASGYGPWSTFKDFTLNVIVLGSPSGTLSSWDKMFHWTGLSGADYYHLEVYDASDVLLYEQWYGNGICSGLDCAVSPAETQNLGSGEYKWRLQAYGASGYSSWTAFQTFQLNLAKVELQSPSGTMTSWDKAFHWTGLSSADFYQVQIYDANDVQVFGQWYTSGICSGLDCAVSPAETQNLANGDYKWRVQSYGSTGYTPWTDYQTFTLNLASVDLLAPAETLDSWNNTFHWTGLSGADYYHLEVRDASSDAVVHDQWFTTSICSGLDCAVSPAETQNLVNGEYKWRVQTYGATGYTPWTDFQTFTLNR
jgi:hypothetical protein